LRFPGGAACIPAPAGPSARRLTMDEARQLAVHNNKGWLRYAARCGS